LRQSAHFALSLAHSFFAASHCFLVHVSTRAAAEDFDESVADAAGAGLFGGAGAEVCAILSEMETNIPAAANTNATASVNPTLRDIKSPPFRFLMHRETNIRGGQGSHIDSNQICRMPDVGFAIPIVSACRHSSHVTNWKWVGAGEGNRTLVCSLGSCRSTIELRPRKRWGGAFSDLPSLLAQWIA
jgi:hypothetical protein